MSVEDRAGNIWDLISETPGEAENLRARAKFMSRINDRLEGYGWSQKDTAEHLDLTQPRVSDLLTGKISKFSLDALVNIGAKVGVYIQVVESGEELESAGNETQRGSALL